jgi:hypothetical protein
MLKKVGIVAVAVTAGVLALSPLAFADGGKDRNPAKVEIEDNSVNRPNNCPSITDQEAERGGENEAVVNTNCIQGNGNEIENEYDGADDDLLGVLGDTVGGLLGAGG